MSPLHATSESIWAQDSVWKQQESGAVSAFSAKVEDVKLAGLRVTFEKLEEGEAPVIETLKICTSGEDVNGFNYTEADRAMAINLNVQAFLRAKRSEEPIMMAIRGPSNPCVYPISL